MIENAAQRYIQANVAPPDPREVNWKDKPLSFKLYRNCEQIPLSLNTRVGTGSEPRTTPATSSLSPTAPMRNALSREEIGQVLVDIYGLTRQCHSTLSFHPMSRFIPKDETGSAPFYAPLLRPVPSGGALFPCELYLLVSENRRDSAFSPNRRDSALSPNRRDSALRLSEDVPAGIYHYDVAHHALDILAQGDATALLQSALAYPGDTPPAYTLLLSSYFWKDGFKYGAFSYRLQGLDIGTVISQSEIIAQHAGLATTIHYQFQDKVLNDLLGLDPLYESVYAVIEWRQGTCRDRGFSSGEGSDGQEKSLSAPANRTLAGSPEALSLRSPKYLPLRDHAPASGHPIAPALETINVPTSGTDHAPTLFGTINVSALQTNETSSRPGTESIVRWPLLAEIHRASLIETPEAFRPLHTLAPIQPLHRGRVGNASPMLKLSADTPLDLWEARTKRRSVAGSFLPTPLTKQQLSQLLRTSMRGTSNDLDGQSDFLQHTLLYCIVFHVTDIPAGVYRYQPEMHALELVREGHMPYEFHRALSMPNFFSLFYMSVNLFPVGNYQSGLAVYGDRWYRMQNMEAGIIAQRLYLAAAALNLGCRASLGFPVSDINSFLCLSDAKDAPKNYQNTSLIQLMIAPERTAYQQYEQSLLI